MLLLPVSKIGTPAIVSKLHLVLSFCYLGLTLLEAVMSAMGDCVNRKVPLQAACQIFHLHSSSLTMQQLADEHDVGHVAGYRRLGGREKSCEGCGLKGGRAGSRLSWRFGIDVVIYRSCFAWKAKLQAVRECQLVERRRGKVAPEGSCAPNVAGVR